MAAGPGAGEGPRPGFFRLPPEIRESIYEQVFAPSHNSYVVESGHKRYNFQLALLRTNRQVYYEARRVFRRLNTFVTIETPWPEAEHHVAMQGYVPLLIPGDAADTFRQQHLAVRIDAPNHLLPDQVGRRFVLHLDDVPKFCQTWYYSDLTHQGLNAHLRLTLHLQDPYKHGDTNGAAETTTNGTGAHIPTNLQKRLLMPFGLVRGLREVVVTGAIEGEVEKDMRKAMATPHTAPEDCLEEATRLKDLGNAALKKADYHEALRLYYASFHAMHIVIDGRIRSIWADPMFYQEMTYGQYKGQHGNLVRLALRVKLVANVVLAFLKLEDIEQAHFWGMRSINLMRSAAQSDEPVTDFIAAEQMGKIYYRTAVAAKALGDIPEARQLLKVAIVYLPHDEIVRKELESVSLRLG